MYVDPLDRVPQIPQDWANHIAYGGAFGVVILIVLVAAGFGLPQAIVFASLVVLAAASAKKIFDYFREGESLAMCVGKALVTAVWPATFLLITALPRIFAT